MLFFELGDSSRPRFEQVELDVLEFSDHVHRPVQHHRYFVDQVCDFGVEGQLVLFFGAPEDDVDLEHVDRVGLVGFVAFDRFVEVVEGGLDCFLELGLDLRVDRAHVVEPGHVDGGFLVHEIFEGVGEHGLDLREGIGDLGRYLVLVVLLLDAELVDLEGLFRVEHDELVVLADLRDLLADDHLGVLEVHQRDVHISALALHLLHEYVHHRVPRNRLLPLVFVLAELREVLFEEALLVRVHQIVHQVIVSDCDHDGLANAAEHLSLEGDILFSFGSEVPDVFFEELFERDCFDEDAEEVFVEVGFNVSFALRFGLDHDRLGLGVAGVEAFGGVVVRVDEDPVVFEALDVLLVEVRVLFLELVEDLSHVLREVALDAVVLFVDGFLVLGADEGQRVVDFLQLLDPVEQTPHPDGFARRLAVVVGQREGLLGGLVCDLQLVLEDLVHLRDLLVDVGFYGGLLRQVVEGLDVLDHLAELVDVFEGRGDQVEVHDLEVLRTGLEGGVVVVPLGRVYVEDFLFVAALDPLDVLAEAVFDLFEHRYDLRPFRPGELGQVHGSALARELCLPFADLDEVAAALDEGLDLREDRVGLDLPGSSGLPDRVDGGVVDRSPRAAAADRVPEVVDAPVHVAGEHVVEVDALLAAVDDFVGDFAQQPRDLVFGFVVLAVLFDQSHTVEYGGHDLHDFGRRGLRELLAGLFEGLQVLQVVFRLFRAARDVLHEVVEVLEVLGVRPVQDLEDPVQLWVLQLLFDVDEVVPPHGPVVDLFEGAGVVRVALVGLVVDEVSDLLGPVREDFFEPVVAVLLVVRAELLVEVVLREVELGLAFLLGLDFGEVGHELVGLFEQVFLDVLGPLAVLEESWDGVHVHFVEQGSQVVPEREDSVGDEVVHVVFGEDDGLVRELEEVHEVLFGARRGFGGLLAEHVRADGSRAGLELLDPDEQPVLGLAGEEGPAGFPQLLAPHALGIEVGHLAADRLPHPPDHLVFGRSVRVFHALHGPLRLLAVLVDFVVAADLVCVNPGLPVLELFFSALLSLDPSPCSSSPAWRVSSFIGPAAGFRPSAAELGLFSAEEAGCCSPFTFINEMVK